MRGTQLSGNFTVNPRQLFVSFPLAGQNLHVKTCLVPRNFTLDGGILSRLHVGNCHSSRKSNGNSIVFSKSDGSFFFVISLQDCAQKHLGQHAWINSNEQIQSAATWYSW